MKQNKNILIYFIGKLIPAFTQLLIIIFGIRVLGVESYGKYNLMFNTSMIIGSLLVGWIQQGALRYFYAYKINEKITHLKFLKLAGYSSLIAFFLSFLWGFFYFNLTVSSLFSYALFTSFFCIFLVELTMLQAQFKASDYAITESMFYCLGSLFAIFFIVYLNQKNEIVFFNAMLFSLLIIMIIKLKGSSNFYGIKIPKDSGFFITIFKYGLPLTIWILISNTFNIIDRFIIEYFIGYKAVGQYSSVYDIIYKVSGFMTLPLLLAFHPEVAKKWNEKNWLSVKQLMVDVIRKEMIVGMIIFTILYFFKTIFFRDALHLDISSISLLFIPLALSSILWQICIILQKPLEFNSRQMTMIGGIIIAIIINIILNILLVPLFGIYICGFVTLFCTLIYLFYVFYFVRKELLTIATNGI
jgi:O-antigen/teichoic acid export membrane protein